MYQVLLVVGCLIYFPAFAQSVTALSQTVNQRLAMMKDVAGYKAAQHLPVEDLAQEAKVLLSAQAEANKLGLEPDSVRPFIIAQMEAAKAIQYRYRADWLAQPEIGWQLRPLTEVRLQIAKLSSEILQQLAQRLESGPITAEERGAFVKELNQLNLSEGDKQHLFNALLLVKPKH
ncbi:chorismate mutase [Chania multitudinisentens RB-25]|uniref:Chorismate mutase n=1 Tax=Chania multitudinisentens RB-25 TaxID=1441930 RepID=W0LJX4_9GAMM|nr:chorismate mutase [Chania multitudinisentens]AHG22290.1 chorismate mutase [Chania multitudinisentens RB-25]